MFLTTINQYYNFIFFFTLCVKARRFEREIVDLQDKCKELAQQNEIKSRKIEELTERFYFYFVKGKKIILTIIL